MIFIIDSDKIMAECVGHATGIKAICFSNVIEAMGAISDGMIPEMIFLEILLDGPDGFTFLHELVSYSDTSRIPIVLVSSLDLEGKDLSNYGVVGFLNKDTMNPKEVRKYVEQYVG